MESIRRQLVVPPYVSAIYMAVGLGMVAAGIVLVIASPSSRPVAALEPEVTLVAPAAPVPAPREAVAAPEAAPPPVDEIKLVFRADGAAYLRLADVGRDEAGALARPPHGAPRLVSADGEAAIAEVREADVPAPHRAWAGKAVVVDGACRATVTGFAVVSRLSGDISYAGTAKDVWDAASVMELGAPVLAARLDGLPERCRGVYARDAALSPVVIPEQIEGPRAAQLAAAARSALIASTAGQEAKQSWDELGPSDAPGAWWEHTTQWTRVLRHPRTGATLVAVHLSTEFACGGPDVNVWGLYRVAADGTLAPVRETRLGELYAIEHVLDVEGDGTLELIGRNWLGDDVVLAGEDGRELARLDMQFYGCPC